MVERIDTSKISKSRLAEINEEVERKVSEDMKQLKLQARARVQVEAARKRAAERVEARKKAAAMRAAEVFDGRAQADEGSADERRWLQEMLLLSGDRKAAAQIGGDDGHQRGPVPAKQTPAEPDADEMMEPDKLAGLIDRCGRDWRPSGSGSDASGDDEAWISEMLRLAEQPRPGGSGKTTSSDGDGRGQEPSSPARQKGPKAEGTGDSTHHHQGSLGGGDDDDDRWADEMLRLAGDGTADEDE